MKPFKGLIIPILFTFGVLIPQSCVTQRRCLEKFPVQSSSDTLIVFRDSIVPVRIPGTPVVSMGVKLQTALTGIRITIKSGTSNAAAYIKHDTLFVESFQSDSTYIQEIDSLLQIIQIKDTQIFTIEEKARFWDRFTGALWVILAIALIIFATKLIGLFK